MFVDFGIKQQEEMLFLEGRGKPHNTVLIHIYFSTTIENAVKMTEDKLNT